MISRKELKDLVSSKWGPENCVLSVYLNVDQGQAANLNRGFEAALRNLLRNLQNGVESKAERKRLQANSAEVLHFVFRYQPSGKSLVIFSEASSEFLWERSLQVPMKAQAFWDCHPILRPLLEARDEFERYGVILTDRAHARLFTLMMGEIEENLEALAQGDVRRFDATSQDQIRSQMSLQRRSNEHARWHQRNVAHMMDRLLDQQKFDRLVLAGPPEAAAELKSLLSERLRQRLVGTLSLPIHAAESEILKAAVALQESVERTEERDKVERLLTLAAKNHQAVVGVEATLEAVSSGRARELIYAEGFRRKGGECLECGILVAAAEELCSVCRKQLRPVGNLLEPLVRRVFEDGGRVEQLKAEAAATMQSAEGVGAFLRF